MRFHNPKEMTFDHLPSLKSISSKRFKKAESLLLEDFRETNKIYREQFVKHNPNALRIPNAYSSKKTFL